MSRLIVKNLPNKVTTEHLKDLFGQKGEVTDVQLKYTKDGKFRNFGFVGYRTEEQAAAAREYFDGTCIRSMKITVEPCAPLGDANKPRAWSKYAPDSTAFKKLHKIETEDKPKPKKKEKKSKEEIVKELLKKHKNDPLFTEFIDAHVNDKTAWIKEALTAVQKEESGDNSDSGVEEEKEVEDEKEPADKEKELRKNQKIANEAISDLEYMKSLMKKSSGVQNKEESKSDTSKTEQKLCEEKPKKVRNRPLFHVKLTGLPYKCKKKDIKDFFRPLVPFTIRFPHTKVKVGGFCFVGFRTEQELKKALNKDKLFIGTRRVNVHAHENKDTKQEKEQQETTRKQNQERNIASEESIGESGSIFVRNLPYVSTEDELTKLFEKYGPISDLSMPIDKVTRQAKGFATVTFMMPEHAVQAYTELDGSIFCGRMLHLLPAKSEKEEEDESTEGLSFKEKKVKKLKAQAKSSHNWNTLFLGANAVADAVASAYSTTKEQLLIDNNKNTSAAVRLALGETQLVSETKGFLEKNGVYLDAFNRPPNKRSKTCILVKNLPALTTPEEIKPLFEKFGHIARFVIPTHGITALVDFIEPFEAKAAFGKLAYSQFKTAPLYLEWAPEDVFAKTVTDSKQEDQPKSSEDLTKKETESKSKKGKKSKKAEQTSDVNTTDVNQSEIQKDEKKQDEEKKVKDDKKDIDEDSMEIDEIPENDTTLFVKNLNFKTTDEALKSHFSSCGRIHSATVAKKKDPKNPGQLLSMGYGFVQFFKKRDATEALKHLQSSSLDGKSLELKRSERGNSNEVQTSKKKSKETKQNGTKILVRNIPFQANRNEIHEIFRAFGELKTVRLPKKLSPGSEQHRGFCFVDFHSKTDAKSAFEALCQSTHLYGRRLVLEWANQSDEDDVEALRKRTAQTHNAKAPGGKKSRKSVVDVDTFVEE